ncbi:hypothetical protein LB465_17655 [Salegentibacter sp. LM13S]|uniref:YobI family P-loop NTPase n=1 Tax=Salegentibacter lacus TaxID=2873599 RepID=UPI001CCC2CB7|nr:hypothetical protein [Salegentibacter lacus]MBZ9632608.1 hypothetical protein [Salegentibacter lacus]
MKKWKLSLYKYLIEISEKNTNKIKEQYLTVTNYLTPLSPIIVQDNSINEYLISLEEGVQKEDVTNIALAGSYGSGKSSIIKTFISQKKGVLNVLEISLANFKKPSTIRKAESGKKELTAYQNQLDLIISKDSKSQEKPNQDEDEFRKYQKLLELSILQQIIYRVSPKKLPDSRFKRIIGFKSGELFSYTILVILWLYSAFILFQYDNFKKLNPFLWDGSKDFDFVAILLGTILFGGLAVFVYHKGIRFVNNSKITRISVKGEIDIGENVDESILNKHLDEVLYFFERTKLDLVVIEDLDRFNDTQIFSKLREINYLINKSSQVRKKVIFLYAVRDDIFEGENRTKFFDLTIPVIPVVDYSNSKLQLKRRLDLLKKIPKAPAQKKELKKKANKSKDSVTNISNEFIGQISFFINDMRMINNICNEYFIYRESQVEIPDQNKLLALIAYKNLKPEDFDLLQKNKGNLYKLIDHKTTFINSKVDNLKLKNTNLLKEIDDLENLIEINISELRGIYISTLLKIAPKNATSIFLNERTRFNELLEESNFEELLKVSNSKFYGIRQNGYENQLPESFSFNDIENEIESDLKYHERENLITQKTNNQIEEKKREISINKREISILTTKTIYQILQEYSIEEYLLSEKNLIDERLIIFLVRNGYIDEHYNNYISKFYDTEVTIDEQKFILNVLNEVNNDIHQSIKNSRHVIQRIPKGFFAKQATLNISLLEYLLNHKGKYQNQINEIVSLIISENEYAINFLEDFIVNSETNNQLFSILTSKWDTIWKFIDSYNYDRNQIERLFILIIENSTVDNLVKIGTKSNFKSFLINESFSLEYFASYGKLEFTTEIIKKMNLHFRDISIFKSSENKELQDYIVLENFYQINYGNISFILDNYTEEKLTEQQIDSANLTSILKSNFEPLVRYVKKEISSYIDNVFLELPKNKEESERTLIYLLDAEELTDIQKELIINKSKNIVNDISEIYDVEAKEILLKTKRLKINWDNVLDYFQALGTDTKLSESLEEFLDSDSVSKVLENHLLTKGNLEEESEPETFLALSIINNSNLSIQNYSRLLKSLHKDWQHIEVDKIDTKKAKALIENKTIKLNLEYFNKLKGASQYLYLNLIELNWDLFSDNFAEYKLEEGDVHYLLESEIINIKDKKQYIENLDQSFLTADKSLSKSVMSIFADLKVEEVEYTFLRDLFKHKDSVEIKIKLLNLNLKYYSKSQLRVLVNRLGGDYSDMVKAYQHPKIPETSENLKLIKGLKDKEVISTYEVKEDIQKIKVNAKKWPTSPPLS